MGWIEPYQYFHSTQEVREHIRSGFDPEKAEIVADSMQLGVWYGAVHNKATGQVRCYITLWSATGRLREGARVRFKDMDETAGPHVDKPTLKVLRALTPLPEGKEWDYARAWRTAAFAHFKNKQEN